MSLPKFSNPHSRPLPLERGCNIIFTLEGSISSLNFSGRPFLLVKSLNDAISLSVTSARRYNALVVAEGVISYKTANNKEESEKFVAAYRRPIAIPDLIIGIIVFALVAFGSFRIFKLSRT